LLDTRVSLNTDFTHFEDVHVFDRTKRFFQVGEWVDVKDTIN